MIRATVVADSVSPAGHRLTTLEVTFPRMILAEVNTHRVFSRNSASSRAVPVRRMLEQVKEDPFVPLVWRRAAPGMVGGEILTDDGDVKAAREWWLMARDAAVVHAGRLLDLGLHKTLPNRVLEPYAWHTAIISGTTWDGFWAQRCAPGADDHMRLTAEAMRAACDASTPRPIGAREWHLPYITAEEYENPDLSDVQLRQVSAGRCAQVSYLNHGRADVEADLDRFARLRAADPPHWSPMEHQAMPLPSDVGRPFGNFTGWVQQRHILGGF
jgi:hypothetical protein